MNPRASLLTLLLCGLALLGLGHCITRTCENACARFHDRAELHGGGQVCLCRDADGHLYEPDSKAGAR